MKQINKKTICLTMIVKNEAHVIARCLSSIKFLIDYWVIVDTGSVDNTKQLVKKILLNIPGKLYERPWNDFASNRNESLQLARNKADYLLILDADEEIELKENFYLPDLTADAYEIMIETKEERFYRAQLIKNLPIWRYKNIIHELLNLPKNKYIPKLNNIKILSHNDSARNKNPNKHKLDLETLKLGALNEPDNLYYQLRLSQYFFRQREFKEALNYSNKLIATLEKAKLDHESAFDYWYSTCQIAEIKREMNVIWQDIMAQYLKAHAYSSWHPAPLYMIGKHYIEEEKFYTAYVFLKAAIEIPRAPDVGFLHKDTYHLTRIKFVFCASKIGKAKEAAEINYELFLDKTLAFDLCELVKKNHEILKIYLS